MSKKPLDTDRMANELKGKSLFFYPKQPPIESAETSPAEPDVQPRPTPETTLGKPKQNPNRARNPGNQEPSFLETRETGDGFDINAERDTKGTFEMTEVEYDALSAMKRPLGRQLGTKITLNDLIRCAINQMLDDYRHNGDDSFMMRHLTRKTPK